MTNLDKSVKISDLEAFFKPFDCATVASIKHRDNKYYTFVSFGSREAASQAMEKRHGSELFGRHIYLDWAGKTYERPKIGFKSNGDSQRFRENSRYRERKQEEQTTRYQVVMKT